MVTALGLEKFDLMAINDNLGIIISIVHPELNKTIKYCMTFVHFIVNIF